MPARETGWSAALIASFLTVFCVSAQQTEDAALELVDKVARAYAAVDTYDARITIVQTISARGQTDRTELMGSIKLARPDRLRVRLGNDEHEFVLNCDGEQCTMYQGFTGRYMTWAQPAALNEVLTHPALIAMLGPLHRALTLPFGSTASQGMLQGAGSVELVPQQQSGARPGQQMKIAVPEGQLDIWVRPETRMITAAEFVAEKRAEQIMAQNPGLKELRLVSTVEIAQQPPDEGATSDFAYEVPEGATLAQTLPELFQPVPKTTAVGFDLPGIKEGQRWRLSEQKGKVVLLDFWATWCPPCRKELPVLAAIWEDYKEQGFLLLAINSGEDRQTVAAFLENQNLDIPVALDQSGQVTTQFGVTGLPTVVLIDREGKARASHTGYRPDIGKQLRAEIDALLADETPD